MAETSGFFPDVSGDREYTSDWLAKYIASIVGNGVYNGELAATADGSAMSVTLPSGRAWINGYHYRNDGDMKLTIDNADGVLNRIDIIVLRWDVNARSITAQVIKGTPASNAMAPAITRTVEQYDLKLAEISIPAGTTAISQALITDCRLDNSVCGIVTGVLDQVDTTTFYSQIQADLAAFKSGSEADFSTWSEQQKASFDSWFNGIKDILGADEAGNLLNLIGEHKADTAAHVTQAEHDSIASAIQGATIAGKPIIKDGAILKIDALPIYNHGYTPTDADTCFEIGIHKCASWTNVPIVQDSQGTLIVLPYAPWPTSSAEGWQEQIYLPINGVGGLPGTIYKRKQNQSSYSSWINIADGGHAASADFASNSVDLTTAGLRNAIIIPNTDSVPAGLAEGTVVLRYTP